MNSAILVPEPSCVVVDLRSQNTEHEDTEYSPNFDGPQSGSEDPWEREWVWHGSEETGLCPVRKSLLHRTVGCCKCREGHNQYDYRTAELRRRRREYRPTHLRCFKSPRQIYASTLLLKRLLRSVVLRTRSMIVSTQNRMPRHDVCSPFLIRLCMLLIDHEYGAYFNRRRETVYYWSKTRSRTAKQPSVDYRFLVMISDHYFLSFFRLGSDFDSWLHRNKIGQCRYQSHIHESHLNDYHPHSLVGRTYRVNKRVTEGVRCSILYRRHTFYSSFTYSADGGGTCIWFLLRANPSHAPARWIKLQATSPVKLVNSQP